MHKQLQVEIVLEKKSLGRLKNPQEIPSTTLSYQGHIPTFSYQGHAPLFSYLIF